PAHPQRKRSRVPKRRRFRHSVPRLSSISSQGFLGDRPAAGRRGRLSRGVSSLCASPRRNAHRGHPPTHRDHPSDRGALQNSLGPKMRAELELKLAEAVGALNVLRGRGAPGSLNVLRQEMLDSVGDALGMVRADFEDKLAVQAKRISELELKLAEAVGALNVLRGKGAPGSLNVRGTFDPDKV